MGDDGDDGSVDALLADFLEEHVLGGEESPSMAAIYTGGADGAVPVHVLEPWDVTVAEHAEWEAVAALSLECNGFCVLRLPAPLVAIESCDALAGHALARLRRLFELARARGMHPRREAMRFTEVCSRTAGGLRYDQRLWSADDACEELAEAEEALQVPCDLDCHVGASRETGLDGAADGDGGGDADSASICFPSMPTAGSDAAQSSPAAEALPPLWATLLRAVEAWVRPVLARRHAIRHAPARPPETAHAWAAQLDTGPPEEGAGGAAAAQGGCEAPASAEAAGSKAMPAAAVRVDSVGCVTSLEGAPDQHFHPDGTADGLVNVFVPLVPVLADNGPTEFRPGTHVWTASSLGDAPDWDERRQHPIAPLLPEPGRAVLLFDYRCYHRGLANRSQEPRPVAYVAFSTRSGVTDAHNFPREASLALGTASQAGGPC